MTLLGYMRVSRSDGSQILDLQRDSLLAAGVAPEHLDEDFASGKRDNRPGLAGCLKALRVGDTLLNQPDARRHALDGTPVEPAAAEHKGQMPERHPRGNPL